jgi:hypothetical protein
MKKVTVLLLILIAGLSQTMLAQATWDTTQYIKYNDRLVIGLFTSWRQFDITFDPVNREADTSGLSHNYVADANSVTGIAVDYDKISFSLGLKTNPDNVAKKGRTTYKNFNFNFGGNKWVTELSYRRYRGFYDKKTALYTKDYTDSMPYYQLPSMVVSQTKVKFLYFENSEGFSYKAAYGNTYRQLKSDWTYIVGGNFYVNKMKTDTSFFPLPVLHLYNADDSLHTVNVVGVSAGLGVGGNLVVFKRFFANAIFILYAEPQWRYYGRTNAPSGNITYLSASGDLRFSVAYNGDRFFISLISFSDFSAINSGALKLSSKFVSGSFNVGYRFKVKTPKFYQKFQETKFYKKL